MFKKILIAEDQEMGSLSVQKTLEELNIPNVDYVYYCDDALAKVKRTIRENNPYDLLITDLSYEEDHHLQNIKDGKELIEEVRKLQPSLKIIVFSGERKSGIIDSLFNDCKINGFVRKARNDSKELKKAIAAVYANESYLSLDLKQEVKKLNSYEFTSYDITLVSLLSQGVQQKNIPTYLQNNNITPNSLSSVEKKLNSLKEALGVKSNEQLIAFCKDLGII
ncbi:DNA-binding response regulator, NarL/FixJ family, contains REC and HTH domains [Chryseobacterium rhizoplanae]|uniref:DNA-binding response regulator, NarL/FixJ family, contains REC and HTH domains n=1 Tax=Chryseobacterium rhizoplanae TaxID=1609531 RepID=A0A521CBC3_9FLAO|nr:response regulator [Chryseobacterium rhizoplanae]SMO56694.1 DNA-binding response regulator, NarL/FixJ family, contains REC and HTH domains [Chryseobacterium rhizoplanae]